MYAIIESGGKQYKVSEGELVNVERLEAEVGQTVELDRVLMVSDGEKVITDKPILEKTKVLGEVVAHDRRERIIVFKKKRRKGYRRTRGHRQPFTSLLIKKIEVPSA